MTTPAECQEFLARHPGIEAVQLFITDPSGVPRGKTASVEELARLYAHGRPVAGSIRYLSQYFWKASGTEDEGVIGYQAATVAPP